MNLNFLPYICAKSKNQIIMRKLLLSFFVLLSVSFARAQEKQAPVTSKKVVLSEALQNIKVDFSTTESAGNVLMNIHFADLSGTEQRFVWRVEASNGMKFQGNREIILPANGEFVVHNAFEIKGGLNFDDYKITLSTK